MPGRTGEVGALCSLVAGVVVLTHGPEPWRVARHGGCVAWPLGLTALRVRREGS